jgi:hypothetical protein
MHPAWQRASTSPAPLWPASTCFLCRTWTTVALEWGAFLYTLGNKDACAADITNECVAFHKYHSARVRVFTCSSLFRCVPPPPSSFFSLIHRSHSISFTRAQGIPKYKIGFGREKDGKVGERLVERLHNIPHLRLPVIPGTWRGWSPIGDPCRLTSSGRCWWRGSTPCLQRCPKPSSTSSPTSQVPKFLKPLVQQTFLWRAGTRAVLLAVDGGRGQRLSMTAVLCGVACDPPLHQSTSLSETTPSVTRLYPTPTFSPVDLVVHDQLSPLLECPPCQPCPLSWKC